MKSTTVTWTCDRCGASVDLPPGERPKWLGLTFGAPPEADPNEAKWPRKHLCPDCDKSFADWLHRRPVTS